MNLIKEYKGSSLKIDISDLEFDVGIKYALHFSCKNVEFIIANYSEGSIEDNWSTYVITSVDNKVFAILPPNTFPSGVLKLIIEQTSLVGNVEYKTFSKSKPIVKLVDEELYSEYCDECFDVFEANNRVLVICNTGCDGSYVKTYENKFCEGVGNVPLEDVPPVQFVCKDGYNVACLGEIPDGDYNLTVSDTNTYDIENEFFIKNISTYNILIKEIIEDLITILCNCGCPSCLECDEIDENYMKDLLTNLNTLLISYSNRLLLPINQVKHQLRCDVIPSDLADECKRYKYFVTGINDNNAQFKKLAAFYYLVLVQNFINNLQYINKFCCEEVVCNEASTDDLPDYFNYEKVIQCIRALGITYKIVFPKIENGIC